MGTMCPCTHPSLTCHGPRSPYHLLAEPFFRSHRVRPPDASWLEAVANAPYRPQVARARRVGLDFLAQAAHVNRNRAATIEVFVAPHLAEQVTTCAHLSRMGREVVQQLELLDGQV